MQVVHLQEVVKQPAVVLPIHQDLSLRICGDDDIERFAKLAASVVLVTALVEVAEENMRAESRS